MFSLQPFSQNKLLSGVPDPVARQGVCVALCDLWLRSIKGNSAQSPAARMSALGGGIQAAIAHQKQYAADRAQLGRFPARAAAGRRVGLDYEEQTTIVRASVGTGGILAKMSADLRGIGAAATWSLRFSGGGGHALAGFCGVTSLTPNMHRQELFVFDPNIGEYKGELSDLSVMLKDIFARVPLYGTVAEVARISAG